MQIRRSQPTAEGGEGEEQYHLQRPMTPQRGRRIYAVWLFTVELLARLECQTWPSIHPATLGTLLGM